MSRILFGIVLGVVLVPIAALVYLKFGNVPVAVTDPPFPSEGLVTQVPLSARIDRQMVQIPPIQPDEATLVAGAHIYMDKCAVCHGTHGKSSDLGENMFPGAPPLWEKHRRGDVVGVSDDPPGETYWKVFNGIRLTGMPDFKTQLNDTQMWQVSLLLANANKPLPPAALQSLSGTPDAATLLAPGQKSNAPANPPTTTK
jgi:mono/diheme cytochrome c family protein